MQKCKVRWSVLLLARDARTENTFEAKRSEFSVSSTDLKNRGSFDHVCE